MGNLIPNATRDQRQLKEALQLGRRKPKPMRPTAYLRNFGSSIGKKIMKRSLPCHVLVLFVWCWTFSNWLWMCCDRLANPDPCSRGTPSKFRGFSSNTSPTWPCNSIQLLRAEDRSSSSSRMTRVLVCVCVVPAD